MARYVVGIDLGTTNTAVAYAELAGDAPTVHALPIPQLIAPGEVAARPTLASFLYLPGPELAPSAAVLPWGAPGHVVGELARLRGAEVPSRLVSSAKSWLSHGGVDRTSALLPVGVATAGSDDNVPRVSPVEASARYLSHVRAAWDHQHANAPLAEQEIFITVPASFDAVARELTVRAANEAGLPHVTLLEEPQAAFYAWLAQRGDAWRKELVVGDVVLVCDVGGGTTDFSLIAAVDRDGTLELERVAVGDHILLGGDNMDLALAYRVKAKLEAQGHTLDNWQTTALVHACRGAKEQLLAGSDVETAAVTILGRGSKLIGGSIRADVQRADVEELIVDGFFPLVNADARPERGRRAALRTLGLPYAADAAVTRHLAAFVGAHKRATAVLFNGGVMKAKLLQRRITETLDGWSDSPEDDLKLLSGTDLDLAVAQGAAYYGLVRKGRGVRIVGGTARAYYIGIESTEPAVPGMSPPLRALCVAPFGMEEGSQVSIDSADLGLVVGEPVEFRFLTSSTRREDRAGVLIEDARSLEELAPVEATIEGGDRGGNTGALVPVSLRARLDEVGTLELSCVERDGGRAHKLHFNLRQGV